MFESIETFTIINLNVWNASDNQETPNFLSNSPAYLLHNLPEKRGEKRDKERKRERKERAREREKLLDWRPKLLVNPPELENFF